MKYQVNEIKYQSGYNETYPRCFSGFCAHITIVNGDWRMVAFKLSNLFSYWHNVFLSALSRITGPAVMAGFFWTRPGRLEKPDLPHADLMLHCISAPFWVKSILFYVKVDKKWSQCLLDFGLIWVASSQCRGDKVSLELANYSRKGSRLSRNKEHRWLPIQIMHTWSKSWVVDFRKKSSFFQIPPVKRPIWNFHLLLGLILETKTEKIAEMLVIDNGYITYFGKVQAILRGWVIKKLSIYSNPQCSKDAAKRKWVMAFFL